MLIQVRKGDTLSGIGARLGQPWWMLDIVNRNLTDPNLIFPGDLVRAPPRPKARPMTTPEIKKAARAALEAAAAFIALGDALGRVDLPALAGVKPTAEPEPGKLYPYLEDMARAILGDAPGKNHSRARAMFVEAILDHWKSSGSALVTSDGLHDALIAACINVRNNPLLKTL